jgi:hypothetical protein
MADCDDEPSLQKSANEVGYGRPPLHSRFQPGRSGNPRGRPKGKMATEEVVNEVLGRKIWVTTDGRRKRITLERGIVLRHADQALKGDLRASRWLLDVKRGYAVAGDPAASADALSLEDLAILASAGLLRIVEDEPDVSP